HQPYRSRHAVCTVSPGDGHDLGRHGDAATVRGRPRRGPKRPTTANCARPAVSTAAGILWRTAMIAWLLAHFGHQHFAERPLCAKARNRCAIARGGGRGAHQYGSTRGEIVGSVRVILS